MSKIRPNKCLYFFGVAHLITNGSSLLAGRMTTSVSPLRSTDVIVPQSSLEMGFTNLGDLRVSKVCLGSMTWGEQNTVEEGGLDGSTNTMKPKLTILGTKVSPKWMLRSMSSILISLTLRRCIPFQHERKHRYPSPNKQQEIIIKIIIYLTFMR